MSLPVPAPVATRPGRRPSRPLLVVLLLLGALLPLGPSPVAAQQGIRVSASADVVLGSGGTLVGFGTVNNPSGGTVTIRLHGPQDVDCTGTPLQVHTEPARFFPRSPGFTPTAAGTHRYTILLTDEQGVPGPPSACPGPGEDAAAEVFLPLAGPAEADQVHADVDRWVRLDLAAPATATDLAAAAPSFAADRLADGRLLLVTQVGNLLQRVAADGTRTTVATLPDPIDPDGFYGAMAVDDVTGEVFVASADAATGTSRVDRLDPTTGALTTLTTTGHALVSMAVDADGQLLAVDIAGDLMVRVDRTTGAVSTLGLLGFDANNAQGMDLDPATGQVVLAAFAQDSTLRGHLRIANTANGATTFVATLGPTPASSAELGYLAIGETPATDEPTDPPTDPTDPPTDPTEPPTEPTEPPTEPTEPSDPPTEPSEPAPQPGPRPTAPPPAGGPDPGPATPTRLQAVDNVARAIAWSQQEPVDTGRAARQGEVIVLLARDDLFADSLSSGGAQGLLGARLLLTPPDHLDPRTRDELERVGATHVVLLGGAAALDPSIEVSLRAQGLTTSRVSGPDRVGTAVAVAELVAPLADRVILARAFGADDPTQGFADALAGGVLAAHLGLPLLLTDGDHLSTATADHLTRSGVQEVLLLGGTDAIGPAVADALTAQGIDVTRLAGGTRAATAAAIATDGLGLDDAAAAEVIALVDGWHVDAWADAFPAARLATTADVLLLLSADTDLPGPTLELLVPATAPLTCATTATTPACTAAADRLGGAG